MSKPVDLFELYIDKIKHEKEIKLSIPENSRGNKFLGAADYKQRLGAPDKPAQVKQASVKP